MLQIHTIPALKDNYFWLIQPDISIAEAYIVDPGASDPVRHFLDEHQLSLKGILITHHHHDHIDGVSELQKLYQVPVYGPDSDRIRQVTKHLYNGDKVKLGSIEATVMAIPGHTLDHIAYLLEIPGSPPLLFSGDTLFAAGCGRLFDGTAALLYQSLLQISSLDDDTLIYAGHEYVLANIAFALSIEPENQELVGRRETEMLKRSTGLPCLPTSLGLERRTNPFMRCHLSSVKSSVQKLTTETLTTNEDVFTSLRRLKDKF